MDLNIKMDNGYHNIVDIVAKLLIWMWIKSNLSYTSVALSLSYMKTFFSFLFWIIPITFYILDWLGIDVKNKYIFQLN
jgi:hypothetical protein